MIENPDRLKSSLSHMASGANSEKAGDFQAVHVHGYWLDQKGTTVALGLRTRLAVRAAASIYHSGEAPKIVVTEGKMWGADYPSGAQLMKDELTNKYNIPDEDIIAVPDAYSTGGEIKTFLDIAKENKWTELLDVAAATHFWTIPSVVESYGGKVTFRSYEEQLKADNHHVVNLISRLNRSRHEWSFKLYESIVWVMTKIMKIDYANLEKRNKEVRTQKGSDFPLPIDVYRL